MAGGTDSDYSLEEVQHNTEYKLHSEVESGDHTNLEWSTPVFRDIDVDTPALLCHKEPAPIIGPFRAWKLLIPYAIKNQRGASKIPLVFGFG